MTGQRAQFTSHALVSRGGFRRRLARGGMWLCGLILVMAGTKASAQSAGESWSESLRRRAFRKYDADHDGRLSRSELDAARKDLARLGINRSPAAVEQYVRQHDLDSDGTLDEQEVKTAPLPGGVDPSSLSARQRRTLERALRVYEAVDSSRRAWERAAQSLPEVLALAVLTLIPVGLLVGRWQALADNRGWRRPTWAGVAVVYGVLLVVVVWAYFSFVPDVW